MAGKVTDKDMGLKRFLRTIDEAPKRRVAVGIVDGEIATYAAANEYGAGNIPERPFMRTTIDAEQERWGQELRDAVGKAIDGSGTLKGAYTKVGLKVRNQMIRTIVNWKTPPNTEAVARRKGANNPLVDTGAMQRAITVEVRKK